MLVKSPRTSQELRTFTWSAFCCALFSCAVQLRFRRDTEVSPLGIFEDFGARSRHFRRGKVIASHRNCGVYLSLPEMPASDTRVPISDYVGSFDSSWRFKSPLVLNKTSQTGIFATRFSQTATQSWPGGCQTVNGVWAWPPIGGHHPFVTGWSKYSLGYPVVILSGLIRPVEISTIFQRHKVHSAQP